MVFCNKGETIGAVQLIEVTILILVDGFLQYDDTIVTGNSNPCHNPYFSRWFSAIQLYIIFRTPYSNVTILILVDGFLQ